MPMSVPAGITSPACGGQQRPSPYRIVGYESWLERDHVMFLDVDPNVIGIVGQPFRLVYQIDDRPVSHTPTSSPGSSTAPRW